MKITIELRRWLLMATMVLAAPMFSTCAVNSQANAGILDYDDVIGQDVTFTNLVETSTLGGELYGQPFADDGDLISSGSGFLAQSAGGGIQLVDGRLQLTVTADTGFVFDEISVETLGSYFGIGADALAVANSFLTIESDGQFFTAGGTVTENGSGSVGWQDDYSITFPETDQVTLTLNTQLLVASGLTSAAFIDSSSIRIGVNAFATSVPEPSSVGWIAIVMLAIVRHRHRTAA